jgi:ribosomal protein L7/L12
MDTISLTLSITNALLLLRNVTLPLDVRDDISTAIENAFKGRGLSVGNTGTWNTAFLNMTLRYVPKDHKVRAIAVFKNTLGYGLRDAKDLVEIVLGKDGYYNNQHRWQDGVAGTPTTITGATADVLKAVKELENMGCEVVVDDYGCSNAD